MMKIDDARQTILSRVKKLAPEKLHIQDALGRYLAGDIRSPIAIPSVDNSAMDGYAVRTQDVTVAGNPAVSPCMICRPDHCPKVRWGPARPFGS